MAFKVTQIKGNSWCIEDEISRAYLFKGSAGALLVDTTNGPGDIRSEVEKLIGNTPLQLLNTHGDWDHIGCNSQFETTLMHPSEFAYYMTRCKAGDAVPVPVQDRDVIDIGSRCFEVFHMPGHTYGSIILLNKEERFIVGGDSLLENVFIFGPQRNLRALIASLERLLAEHERDYDCIYTAHFSMTLGPEFLPKQIAVARALLNKEIKGVDAGQIPLEGPEFKPAQLYARDGIGFFDYVELPY